MPPVVNHGVPYDWLLHIGIIGWVGVALAVLSALVLVIWERRSEPPDPRVAAILWGGGVAGGAVLVDWDLGQAVTDSPVAFLILAGFWLFYTVRLYRKDS